MARIPQNDPRIPPNTTRKPPRIPPKRKWIPQLGCTHGVLLQSWILTKTSCVVVVKWWFQLFFTRIPGGDLPFTHGVLLQPLIFAKSLLGGTRLLIPTFFHRASTTLKIVLSFVLNCARVGSRRCIQPTCSHWFSRKFHLETYRWWFQFFFTALLVAIPFVYRSLRPRIVVARTRFVAIVRHVFSIVLGFRKVTRGMHGADK